MEINRLAQNTGIAPKSMPKAGNEQQAGDKVFLSEKSDSGMSQIEALKKMSAGQGKSDIESLEQNLSKQLEKVTNLDTPIDEACNEWDSYVTNSEAYLKNPESFDRNYENFLYVNTPDKNVRIVGVQAPWPITGTMDQWNNYIQERTPEGNIILTPTYVSSGEEGDISLTHYEDARTWDNNGKECITLIGRAKADGVTGAWEVSVFEKGDGTWVKKENAFGTIPGMIEGREIGLYGGTLSIDDSFLNTGDDTEAPRVIPSFGKNNEIQLLDTKDNSITTFSAGKDGVYQVNK